MVNRKTLTVTNIDLFRTTVFVMLEVQIVDI